MALNRDGVITIRTKSGPKDFVLWWALLDLGHQQGLIAIENEVVETLSDPEKQSWVVRSTGRFRSADGEAIWSAHGDASPANSQMHGAYLRHAETRAAARMLRMATNVGMTAFEELGPDVEATAGGDGATHSGVQQQGGARGAAAAREQPRTGTRAAPVGDTAGDRRAAAGSLGERPAAPAVASVAEFCEECGHQIEGIETKKGPVSVATIVAISEQRWQKALCHACGKARIEMEQANLPAGVIA